MTLYENGVIAYEVKPCPICSGFMIEPFTALSRADNKTKICPDCGKAEARAGVTRGDSIPGTDTRVVGPRFAVRITDTE